MIQRCSECGKQDELMLYLLLDHIDWESVAEFLTDFSADAIDYANPNEDNQRGMIEGEFDLLPKKRDKGNKKLRKRMVDTIPKKGGE